MVVIAVIAAPDVVATDDGVEGAVAATDVVAA